MYMTSRAAQYCLAGRMRPVGRRLESPGLYDLVCSYNWAILEVQQYHKCGLLLGFFLFFRGLFVTIAKGATVVVENLSWQH